MPRIASEIRKPKIGLEPRSVRSKPAPSRCSLWCKSVMSNSCVIEEFLRMQVVLRQQRSHSQVAEKVGEPQATDCSGNHKIQNKSPVECRNLIERWFDVPEQVQKTHKQNPHRESHQHAWISLERTRQQERERYCELEDHQRQPNVLPPVIEASRVEPDFLGEVPGPDDQ